MKNTLTEIAGWYGVVAIVSAYALSSLGFLAVQDTTYQVLNRTGAIGVVLDALDDKNYQPAVLNIIWAIVAVLALIGVSF